MEKLRLLTLTTNSRKIPIAIGVSTIFLVVIDLLMTRQLLPYDNVSGTLMFILTMSVGYGIGALILLKYTCNISKEIRHKSSFVNAINWLVIVISSLLFVLLLIILLIGNHNHFLSYTVFAVSSAFAAIMMIIISIKFFFWYKVGNHKTIIILFYAIVTLTLALSIVEDTGTKLLLVNTVQEKSPAGVSVGSSFFLYII